MLEIKGICKKIKKREILNDISFTIDSSERVNIIGKSGCGKTTLLNIITGMLDSDSGKISLNGKDITRIPDLRQNYIGYMACGGCLLDALTVYENLDLVRKTDKKEINNILKALDIYEIRNSHPDDISSGEYRRVLFARTVIMDTPYIVLDEPTSNLDSISAEMIINYLNTDKMKEKGIIIATHDKRLYTENRQGVRNICFGDV